MNIKAIISIIIGIVLLNNSLFPIITLPGIISLIALIGAAAILLMDSLKGGMIAKVTLVFGIIIGIYALAGVLAFVGISIPFISYIYRLQRLALTIGGILLIISPFTGF